MSNVEPWWVQCIGETLPILAFVLTMFIVARCKR